MVGQPDYTRYGVWRNEGRFYPAPLRKTADSEYDTSVASAMNLCIKALQELLQYQPENPVMRVACCSGTRVERHWALRAKHKERAPEESYGGKPWRFMTIVTKEWDDRLGPYGEQRTNTAEGLPILSAMVQTELKEIMRGMEITININNTAAEWTLRRPPPSASGVTATYLYAMSAEVWKQAHELDIRMLIARVPSRPNPVDPIPRQDDRLTREAGWKRVPVEFPRPWTLCWMRTLLQQPQKRKEENEGPRPKARRRSDQQHLSELVQDPPNKENG